MNRKDRRRKDSASPPLPAAPQGCADWQLWEGDSEAGLPDPGILSEAFSPQQVVHEIRNYPYPQLHFLALQGLNPSRHTSAVRESYEVRPAPLSGGSPPILPGSLWVGGDPTISCPSLSGRGGTGGGGEPQG